MGKIQTKGEVIKMPTKKYRFVIEKELPDDILPDIALELMSETIMQALGSMTIEDFEIVKPLTEDDIMDLILKHGNLLNCFNCGKSLTEVVGERRYKHGNDKFMAALFLDPGISNYPREPDVPASVYFICSECDDESVMKKKVA